LNDRNHNLVDVLLMIAIATAVALCILAEILR